MIIFNRNNELSVCVFATMILLITSCKCDCTRKFNPPAWSNNPSFRYLLVDDLMSSKRLDTLKRSNLDKVLGAPGHEFKHYNLYGIGIPKGKFPPEPSCLVIEFDDDNNIIDYSVSNCYYERYSK